MKYILLYLRYDWPLHFVLLLTNWLPDNVKFLRLRGRLCKPFFGSCGHTINIGRNIAFHNPSLIHLGNFVHISYGCVLMATDHIWIEDEVMFGPYCVLVSGNHSLINHSFRFGPSKLFPICIKKGAWIGAHVTVTAGAEIGVGCLVAAGAVVPNQKFADHTLLGGVPARAIKSLDDDAQP